MIYAFDEFELDTRLFELRRAGERCPMEPQVFTVLAYLVEHRDRVVPKNELIDHVWPERFISEAALTSRLMAARKALGDSGHEQRYIKTLHGRGYRFAGDVHVREHGPAGRTDATTLTVIPQPAPAGAPPTAFGRERELDHLRDWYETAAAGARSVVFVTGDAGLGKSTVIETFVSSLAGSRARVAVGHCVEQRGVGEAYMPVIEALSKLCESSGNDVKAVLARRAPVWLLQMPWLLSDEDLLGLRERALGATSERMLREAAEAIEELSADSPVVLVLEDLHWSDQATLDLVGWLARRRDPARLLIIGSYRPRGADAEGAVLALERELRVRGLCHELALPFLAAESVSEYVLSRFPGLHDADAVSALLLKRTEGNPLFFRAVLDSWQSEGVVRPMDGAWQVSRTPEDLASGVPDTIRGLIEERFDALNASEQRLLEAAAVAGTPFSAAIVAAVIDETVEAAEERCEHLRRRGGLLALSDESSEWPDGTIAATYRFAHALYEEAIYERIPPNRRARLHQQVGERLERAFLDEAEVHAVELARHFVLARDAGRSVTYLRAAADQAVFRGAHRESIDHLRQALDMLQRLPDTPERVALEAEVQSMLGGAVIATKGFGSAEAERAYQRALELTTAIEDVPRRSAVIFGLAALLEYQGKHVAAQQLLEQVEAIPDLDRELRIPYHALLSCSLFHQGVFQQALEHGDRGVALQSPSEGSIALAFMGEDAMLGCREWSSVSLWFLGYPDLAVKRIRELLAQTQREDRRYAYASALSHAARIHHLRREPALARSAAEQASAVAGEYGFAYHAAVADIVAGWALAAEGRASEGIALVHRGLDVHRDTGAEMDRPYYLSLLAEACRFAGDLDASTEALREAVELVGRSRAPFFYEAELHRQRAVSLFETGAAAEAESLLRDAIDLARKQEAKTLELRAAVSLGQVTARGDASEATSLVAALLGWFTEGFDTADYRLAKSFVESGATAGAGGPKRRRR